MPAHVYPYHKNPANDTQKKVGYGITCYLQIRNNGDGASQCYFGINKDGSECGKHMWNVWLEPGAAKNLDSPCKFTMPDRRQVKIEYFGGHYDYNVNDWIEDFSDIIYIDPEVSVVSYCSQTFKVVDSVGRPLPGARVHLANSRNVYQNTDSSGYITFNNLSQGRTHYVSAEKSGYSSSETKSFTPPTGTITLMLGATCNCTEWVKQECVRDGVRKYTRTCTPSGCLPEVRTISDSSCVSDVVEEGVWVPITPENEGINAIEIAKNEGYDDVIALRRYDYIVLAVREGCTLKDETCVDPEYLRKYKFCSAETYDTIGYGAEDPADRTRLDCVVFRALKCVKFVGIEAPAEGIIKTCNINALPCPNCGTAKPSVEISVVAEMENIGNEIGKFRFYIYTQEGNILSKEPDLTYKNVAAGSTWKVTKTLTTNLNFKMGSIGLNGILKLVNEV